MNDRDRLIAWIRTAGTVAAMIVLYFVVPIDKRDGLPVAVATTVTVLSAVLIAALAAKRIRAVLQGDLTEGAHSLIVVLALAVLGFAMGYYLLARSDPTEMAGLSTRLDALYFTLTTLATVGYGDIHPSGQAARAVACVNLLFNAVIVASLARTLLGVVSRTRAARAEAPTSESS
jgi:voltage-gated potassium channel